MLCSHENLAVHSQSYDDGSFVRLPYQMLARSRLQRSWLVASSAGARGPSLRLPALPFSLSSPPLHPFSPSLTRSAHARQRRAHGGGGSGATAHAHAPAGRGGRRERRRRSLRRAQGRRALALFVSLAAELQSLRLSGIARMLAKQDAVLSFTCMDMKDEQQPGHASCSPELLV